MPQLEPSTHPSASTSPPMGAAARLGLIALCVGVGLFFWSSPFLYPLKLLVVMMHESGHALATLLFGGHVQRVVLGTDESGSCLSALPPGFFGEVAVYSAGYLGSLLAGGLLLILNLRFRVVRPTTWALAGWLALMAVGYAGNAFTLFFCLATSVVLGLTAAFVPKGVVTWVNLFVAVFSGLYAVLDIRDDLWNPATRGQSDAALLANLTHIPALVWAGLWSLCAGVMLYLLLRASLKGSGSRAKAPASPLDEVAQLARASGRATSMSERQ